MYSGVAKSSYRQHCWSGRGYLSHVVRKGTPQRERSGIGRGTPQSANQLTAEGEGEEGGKVSLMREQVYTYSKKKISGHIVLRMTSLFCYALNQVSHRLSINCCRGRSVSSSSSSSSALLHKNLSNKGSLQRSCSGMGTNVVWDLTVAADTEEGLRPVSACILYRLLPVVE